MNSKPTPGHLLAFALVALSAWVVHDFVDAIAAAIVIAVASWPLYRRFRAGLPRAVGPGTAALVFTMLVALLVLAPLVLAAAALLGEAHALLTSLLAADGHGIALPAWLPELPLLGPWLAGRWQAGFAAPGALLALTQHADPGRVFGWLQWMGGFSVRQLLSVAFAMLLLAFFYRDGATLADEFAHALRRLIGRRADRYLAVSTRAVRASVASMFAVGAFDALAAGLAFALAGTPRGWIWAAITGALAAVPFLGYAAVGALGLQLALKGPGAAALTAVALGAAVLLVGDKVVRPIVAREGLRLPFVWVLIGCIGGFATMHIAGLVIGPLALALAHEMWEQHAGRGAP
jgi:predicted PurR-regulated permease PerM